MIKRQANLGVCRDDKGVYFHSDEVDLDKSQITIPIDIGNVVGTVDFSRRSVILHPPNGDDIEYTADDFIKRWGEIFGLGEME